MAKHILDTIVSVGGFSGEYEALTEVEIAATPGASYSPPEEFGNFRVVDTRVVQLLGGSPMFIESYQSSSFTLRVPVGEISVNDAADGRVYYFLNNGMGPVTIETADVGTSGSISIGTIQPNVFATIIHRDNNSWGLFRFAGTGAGSGTFSNAFRYTGNSGIPGAGTLYLSTGPGVACSAAGDRLIEDVLLTGLSIRTDTVDASRDYRVEVLLTPSALTPTVLATLDLPSGSNSEGRNDLEVLILAPNEVGVRIVRAAGGGASSFNAINVNVQFG
jgi:hypothetical protein